VDLSRIASTAFQTSGADLANLVNEAALSAGRDGRKEITMDDFRDARDRLLLPRTGGSVTMLDEERRITAYHEAGHAIAAVYSDHSDPIEKVTIAPQGGALGFVMQSPDRDRVFESKARLEARLVVAAAGREAEKLFFGPDMVTTGAASDIRQATNVARAMVMQYGMSKLGFVYIDAQDSSLVDINNPVAREIEAIISKSIADCATLLNKHKVELKCLAEALLEQETLTGTEVRDLIAKTQTEGTSPDDKWSYYC
jgi:ATP-dependent Zn protease